MVIASKDWMENVEDTKPLLDPNNLIMAAPVAVNSNENAVRIDWKQQVQSTIIGTQNNRNNELRQCARAVLYCQANSHPFQTRTLLLEPSQEVKVGRSIARNRVSEKNAIFDCKVLSRNHAVIWYCDGKFYVKDTRSSNGTFINDRRISQSDPEELHFGDIIKFGVDVIENSGKEVHGCIIACIKLYLPDGREFISNSPSRTIPGEGTISLEELHRLHHYMQEAVQREKILEVKLHDIQKIIEMTRKNTSTCWQAMIDEDRLLNRIDILENKLQFFQKNAPESNLREEIMKLQEDKCLYQNSAKEALRKVYQERMDAMQKLSTIERALCSSEDECSLLRDQLLRTQQNLQEVNARLTRFESDCKEYQEQSEKAQNQVQKQDSETQKLYEQLNEKGEECEEYKTQVYTLMAEMNVLQKHLNASEKINDTGSDAETISTENNAIMKGTVLKWLENSDLKNKEESAEIIRAICNDPDDNNDGNNDFDFDLTLVYNKLINLKTNLSELSQETKIDDQSEADENSSSSTQFNNGNSDSDLKYEDALKSSVSALMEVYNELFHNASYLKGVKENLHHREKSIDAKYRRSQEELNSLRLELEARPTYNQFQEKININETLQNDIAALNIKQQEMQDQIDKLTQENFALEESCKVRTTIEKIDISLQTEGHEENENNYKDNSSRDSEDIFKNIHPDLDLVDSDLEVLQSPTIQQEEELIIFKEKYESVTSENLELKQKISGLQSGTSDVQRTVTTTLLLGGAVFVVFISYIFSSFFSL